MLRSLVIIASSLILWAMVAQVNHVLSSEHIYVFVGGLFVTYTALTFPLRSGMICSVVAGLLCDSAEPVSFGTFLVLFATAHAVIFNLRNRIPRDDTMANVLVGLFANLGIFLALCFIQMFHAPVLAGAWPRILVDLLISQICIAIVGPWFFALQAKSLALIERPQDRIF